MHADGDETNDAILEGAKREEEEYISERESEGERNDQIETDGNQPAPKELAEAFEITMRQYLGRRALAQEEGASDAVMENQNQRDGKGNISLQEFEGHDKTFANGQITCLGTHRSGFNFRWRIS
jgi:hypothetical protein